MPFLYRRFQSVFILFLLAQPFIDVFTSINARQTGSLMTIGTFLRFAFMVYFLGYVLIEFIQNRKQNKLPILFFGLSTIAIIVSIIVNYLTKHPYWFVTEMKFYAKSYYFIVILYASYFFTKKLKSPGRLVAALAWISFIYGLFIILPDLVGLGFQSYHHSKGGTIGLFFSANEVGAILASLTPYALYYALSSPFHFRMIYKWLPFVSSLGGMYLMGTKVALLSGIVITLFGFITVIVNVVKKLKFISTRSMLAFVIVGFIALGMTPFTPAITNAKIQSSDPHLASSDDGTINMNQANLPREVAINKHVKNKYLKILLNNRDRFFFNRYHDFQLANPYRKLFGLGYAGDYYTQPKIVEMDFLDAFISYGIIGSILYLSPLLFFIIASLIYFVRFWRVNQRFMMYSLLVGGIMGVGISFISGHVLFQPAASIYLAILMTFFLSQLVKKEAA